MKTRVSLLAALLFAFGASAEAIEYSAQSLRTIKIFRNVSGSTQPSGTPYVLQEAATDTNIIVGEFQESETTLGMDVTTTTTADSDDAVGVQIDPTCVDDAYCRVVTYGPVLVRWAGATDNTNTRLADVGTTTLAGSAGSGTLLGTLLSLTVTQSTAGGEAEEVSASTDGEARWIFVNPQNN